MESSFSIRVFKLLISFLIIWLAYHYSMPGQREKFPRKGTIGKINSSPPASFKKSFNG